MNVRWLRHLLPALTVAFLYGQTPKAAPAPAKPAAPVNKAPAAPKPAAPAKPAREPGLYAIFTLTQGVTPIGTIVTKLFETESPKTVKNFTDLAQGRKEWRDPHTGQRVRRPLYNGLTFHRVIPGFMIQGGDPLGTGTGGTDPIEDEFHPTLKFDVPGRLAMANAGPGTGSSQFFITDVPTPHLDGRHTIFGQVIEGQDVVAKVMALPRTGEKPNVPVKMRVTVQRVPKPGAAPVQRKAAPAQKKAVAPVKKT